LQIHQVFVYPESSVCRLPDRRMGTTALFLQ
jgi:hypothetical protein